MEIPKSHPRAESLRIREALKKGFEEGLVVEQGLMAHGRGEAFDYLLGEKTTPIAIDAIKAAAATLLLAEKPVISVNGNVAALTPKEVVQLAYAAGAKIEVNLFYRTHQREKAIEKQLKAAGAREVLGVNPSATAELPGLESLRRKVDQNGIMVADVVLVPLEDGDRTEALRRLGKTVIAIDLNPFSRTAQTASVTIVDNLVRAMPLLMKEVSRLRGEKLDSLLRIVDRFDNRANLGKCISYIAERLMHISKSTGKVSDSSNGEQ
ncbi:MAG: phosphopantothenate/pantothenate synthetase [Thaumarchaeota archaeon]|nr:phosphopantothenate/pantothenate synthetase [Nitrososphaerota archaeon]MCL5316656.1 phosphopantothenate/pantothenate synthetase [Nitrososphaerota archaeon]